MRWFTLITAFVLVCFISLIIFIWTCRTELTARCLDLSLQNTRTHVESVTALSLHSLSLKNITISENSSDPSYEPLQIDQIVLELRTTELLSWMLLPLRNPLIIESATIIIQNQGMPLTPISKQHALFIRKVDVILANSQQITLGEQIGTPGSILTSILQTIQSEKAEGTTN